MPPPGPVGLRPELAPPDAWSPQSALAAAGGEASVLIAAGPAASSTDGKAGKSSFVAGETNPLGGGETLGVVLSRLGAGVSLAAGAPSEATVRSAGAVPTVPGKFAEPGFGACDTPATFPARFEPITRVPPNGLTGIAGPGGTPAVAGAAPPAGVAVPPTAGTDGVGMGGPW